MAHFVVPSSSFIRSYCREGFSYCS